MPIEGAVALAFSRSQGPERLYEATPKSAQIQCSTLHWNAPRAVNPVGSASTHGRLAPPRRAGRWRTRRDLWQVHVPTVRLDLAEMPLREQGHGCKERVLAMRA